MNCRAKRVMFLGTPDHPSMIIEFADGRLAQMYQTPNSPFRLTLEEKGSKSDVVPGTKVLIKVDAKLVCSDIVVLK